MNEDARSPGAGSTPGPLSQQAPVLDTSDPGENNFLPSFIRILFQNKNTQQISLKNKP